MIFYKRNKNKERRRWHIWFAWFPVKVSETPDGDTKKIWLGNVLRCETLLERNGLHGWYDYYGWKYKELKGA